MNSDAKKKNKQFVNRIYQMTSVVTWGILICAVITYFLSGDEISLKYLALAEAVLFIGLIVLKIMEKRRHIADVSDYAMQLNTHMDTATKESLVNFPFPMVMAHLDGKVSWYNQGFAKVVDGQVLFEKYISEIVTDLKWSDVLRMHEGISIDVTYNEKVYKVMGSIIKPDSKKDGEYLVLLYWLDETEQREIKKKYTDEKIDIGIIMIDNYDDVLNGMEDWAKPRLISKIDQKVNEWVKPVGGVLKKPERDRYIMFFEHKNLAALIEKKFEILDWVREINVGNKTAATISVGIGTGGDHINVNDEYSRNAINMALGRGGDQAVIKDENQFNFFGGKSNEHEKSTRVKSRVIAQALRQLIISDEKVVIMGHKRPDLDSIGSAVGLSRGVKNRNKPVKIVCGEHNLSVDAAIDAIKAEEDYDNMFISPQEAEEYVDKNTVLIIVDVHRPALLENEKLLSMAGEIVLIDHHRRSTDFIENCSLVYHEPYASSASELVTELLQYMDNKVSLTKAEAEALYAGICMDTKNFTFKTGVRTFDAASFLRKHGVDTVRVKKMFQIDMAHYNNRSEIVGSAKFVRKGIALALCERFIEDVGLVVAQAADELLEIEGVEASFVIAKDGEANIVSGRSWGKVNVQVILEKIGGGGHMTVAGAQIRGESFEEVKKRLTDAIFEYFEEKGEK